MTHSPALILARDALTEAIRVWDFYREAETRETAAALEAAVLALTAIDAELAASADAGRQDDEPGFRATVAMLLEHAKRAKKTTHEEVLEIAAMEPNELRRRAIVGRDWHRLFAESLDGLPALLPLGAPPDGCWFPRDIRRVVECLLAALARPAPAEESRDAVTPWRLAHAFGVKALRVLEIVPHATINQPLFADDIAHVVSALAAPVGAQGEVQ